MSFVTSWNFADLAQSDTDPNLDKRLEESRQAVAAFRDKWRDNGDYLTKPAILKQALDELELLERDHGCNAWQSYYFSLRLQQNQLDNTVKTASRVADEASIELYNQLQFFTLSLAKIGTEQQALFLADSQLSDYRYFLQQLFAEQPYVLSDQEEKILNLVSQPAVRSWVDMTESFLAKEEVESLSADGQSAAQTVPQLMALLNNSNKPIRDQAADHVHAIMGRQSAVATEEMNAVLGFKKINDDLRGFARPDAGRHLGDGIDSQTVDSMLDAVSSRNDLPHKFYSLKAQLLAQDKLAYHERNVEAGSVDSRYSFEDTVALINKVFSQLDPEFATITTKFITDGRIDVFPAKGKSGGAFCAHNLLTQPTYILLNHTDRLQDVLTMAHELGHGINNELTRQVQNSLNFGTSLATAEVASTFMEDFVLEELLKEADPAGRLAILMMKLNDDMSSIFRQVACYRFEQSLHRNFRQKGYLSTEEIGDIFNQHMAEYMGPAVEQTSGCENWWVYWSHIRNSFYVYSYASGLLISKSLQAMVHSNAKDIQKVKQFMAAGTSDSPSGIFAAAGITINDASFWSAGLNQIESLLDESYALARELKLIKD